MSATHNIGYMLQHLAFTMGRQNDQILQERLGIGFSQFKILMVLEKNPYIQQSDIADALGQTEASISRQIGLMHDKGLLQTRIDPENRRRHITIPTTKGLRLNEEAMRALNSFHAPVFSRLSEKEQLRLLDTMAKMHDNVCDGNKKGTCSQINI